MSAEFGRSMSLFTIHGQDKLTHSEIVRGCSGWNDKWLVEIFVTYRHTFPVVIPTKRVMQRHMFLSLPFFLWGWVGVHIITSRPVIGHVVTSQLVLAYIKRSVVQTKFMFAHNRCQEPTLMTKNLSHWSKRSMQSIWLGRLAKVSEKPTVVGVVAVSGMPWECQLFFFLILSQKRAPNKSKGWAFGGLKFTLLVKRDVICLLLMPFAWFRTIVFWNSDKFQLQSSCRRMRRIDENWNNKFAPLSSITKSWCRIREMSTISFFRWRFHIALSNPYIVFYRQPVKYGYWTHFARNVSSQGIKGSRERT